MRNNYADNRDAEDDARSYELDRIEHEEKMKTDNELIAEFMGWRLEQPESLAYKYWRKHLDGRTKVLCVEDGLLYNTSWDWLMPVVERITDLTVRRDDGSIALMSALSFHLDGSHYDPQLEGKFTSSILGSITFCHNQKGFHTYEKIDFPSFHGKRKKTTIAAAYEAVVEFIKWHNSVAGGGGEKA